MRLFTMGGAGAAIRALLAPLLAPLLAALLLALAAGCAAEVPAGQQKPLDRDYEPPPIDGFPDTSPPSRI